MLNRFTPMFLVLVFLGPLLTVSVSIAQAKPGTPPPPPPPPTPVTTIPPPPPPPGEKAAASPGGAATSEQNPTFHDDFVYDPTGLRDPFESEAMRQVPVTPDDNGQMVPVQQTEQAEQEVKEPLQTFELEKIRILAIVWDTKSPKALVSDPNQNIHTVHINTKIGKRGGKVVGIREGEVVVMEYVMENNQASKTYKIMELR